MAEAPHAPGHECVPHIVAEAWIAVVNKHPRAPEESILGIGGVSDELRDPWGQRRPATRTVRMRFSVGTTGGDRHDDIRGRWASN